MLITRPSNRPCSRVRTHDRYLSSILAAFNDSKVLRRFAQTTLQAWKPAIWRNDQVINKINGIESLRSHRTVGSAQTICPVAGKHFDDPTPQDSP